MSCPGFSIVQKDNVAFLVDMPESKMRDFNMPMHASEWRHLHALSIKPGVPLDVVEYYIALIRGETERAACNMSIDRQQQLRREQDMSTDYWGYFWREAKYPESLDFKDLSLARVATAEWVAIGRILRRAVEGGRPPVY
ncbi:uncharacterized protein F4822DRAFT_118405 [Hypoxylon trugodes]|uniref:uncharacterized protein n=1 Tax=Hypoxylon trugodes TaxID=326681 RepID=UPI0021919BE8|nr:uncharacterized protein F4822DRAFT_118405 [Hypoxylon trugodes]KAI1392183.1 hypothetical protein F4822DRAFT_118405 [Hypoxylon trugodes]